MKRAILLLIDGLRPDVAERELAAGHLPHLARLTDGGGRTRAITAFPSTTSVSYLPFLTGCLPGRCNVPSIRWMDRTRYTGRWWADRHHMRSYCGYQAGMLDGDIPLEVRTLFELVPESAAFFTMITRGLTQARDPSQGARKFWGGLSHYILWHQPGDDAVSDHLLRWIRRDSAWRFLFAQFPAVDGYTHQSHPEAPSVLGALRKVDATVGRLAALLAEQGQLDNTLIVVVSDHGASEVRHHLDLADWFRRRGVPTVSHPELWRRDPRAAVMVAGNGSANVYAQPNTPRQARWSMARLREPSAFGSRGDLVAELLAEPGVAFVAAGDGHGGVRVASIVGEAVVAGTAERLAYRIETGDPLGIGRSAEMDQRAWLGDTFHGEFPDGPVQLLDQFRAGRGGDLLVVARKGYDFRERWEIPEHKSGHGSMIQDHMHTPLWANRPITGERLRTADVFASLLAWLGEPIPAEIDGHLVWHPGVPRAVAEPGVAVHLSRPGNWARSSAG